MHPVKEIIAAVLAVSQLLRMMKAQRNSMLIRAYAFTILCFVIHDRIDFCLVGVYYYINVMFTRGVSVSHTRRWGFGVCYMSDCLLFFVTGKYKFHNGRDVYDHDHFYVLYPLLWCKEGSIHRPSNFVWAHTKHDCAIVNYLTWKNNLCQEIITEWRSS